MKETAWGVTVCLRFLKYLIKYQGLLTLPFDPLLPTQKTDFALL